MYVFVPVGGGSVFCVKLRQLQHVKNPILRTLGNGRSPVLSNWDLLGISRWEVDLWIFRPEEYATVSLGVI